MLLGNQYNENISSAIEQLVTARLVRIDTVIPAEIVSVSGNRATVQPLIDIVYTSETESRPQLEDIPIYQISSSNAVIYIPIKAGDKGLLLACQRDIDTFKESYASVSPPSERIFSFVDAIFMPLDFQQAISPSNTDALCIQSGGVQIVLNGDTLEISTNSDVTIASTGNTEITTTGDCKIEGVNVDLKATGICNVDGASVSLAGGGAGIARIGDAVATPQGNGTIIGGSTKVTCG